MKPIKTQIQHFYDERRKLGEKDRTFMELIQHPTHPMTNNELQTNINRRPSLWKRYEGFVGKLKD